MARTKKGRAVTEIRENPKRGKGLKLAGKQKIMSPRAVQNIELDWQIFEMRRDGHSVDAIARALGVHPETVRKHLQEVLERTVNEMSETAEENRQLQIERLDYLLTKYTKMAYGYKEEAEVLDPLTRKMKKVIQEIPPNMAAASLVLSIEARRSKLLALDMPEVKKLDVTGIREYVGVDIDKV